MNNLADYLTEIADEVRPADLGERVRAASRRVRRRRRTAVAVAVAVAVVSGIAWAGRTARPDTPADLVPAPIPSLYYDAGIQVRMFDGGTVRDLMPVPGPVCGLSVSPDHRLVAWTETDSMGTLALIVANPDGSGRRRVLNDVICAGGNSPAWLPDSRRMLVAQDVPAPRRLLDVYSLAMTSTPVSGVVTYVAWSPNGEFVAYDDDGEIVVARAADGTVVHRVHHDDESGAGGFSVQGVSDDGRRAVIGLPGGPSDRITSGFRVVDTGTGADVPLPAGIAPADRLNAEVHPAAGDRMLVRVTGDTGVTLYLLDAYGRILDRRAEPAALREATLLGQ
ncbi:TolB family protein [Paractinoplanes toevensis]|uniref:Uncharacterized protein n=1 Tax=Paractinoplanes toevensis TaxID=571911 RepID=A0A919W6K4_9ACTN|nr:hypothetical protein [Actinoplanes toevensis]GIM94820.1 hypothetical protein Ato02nite_066130 [Actinoplanes toevensis]